MTNEQIAAISERILVKFAETGSMTAAIDAVFGPGSYEKIAGEIYNALREKAGA